MGRIKSIGGYEALTIKRHKAALSAAQCRPSFAPEMPLQDHGCRIMFASLMHKLRRWIGYRPERRYMRGSR